MSKNTQDVEHLTQDVEVFRGKMFYGNDTYDAEPHDYVSFEDYQRLTAELAEARRALDVFAKIPFDEFGSMHRRPEHILMGWNSHNITTGDVMAARAALKEQST